MSLPSRLEIERRKAETKRKREMAQGSVMERQHDLADMVSEDTNTFPQYGDQHEQIEQRVQSKRDSQGDLSDKIECLLGKWTSFRWKAGNPLMIDEDAYERPSLGCNQSFSSGSSSRQQQSEGEQKDQRSQSASISNTDSAKDRYKNHTQNSHHRSRSEQRSDGNYRNHGYESSRSSSTSLSHSGNSYHHNRSWHSSSVQSSSQGSSSSTSHRKPNPAVSQHSSGPPLPARGTSSEREGQQHHGKEPLAGTKHTNELATFHPNSDRKSRGDSNRSSRLRGPSTPPCSPPSNHSTAWTPSPPDQTPPPSSHTPPPRHQTPPPSNKTSPYVDQAHRSRHPPSPPSAPAETVVAQRTPPPTAGTRSDVKGDTKKPDLTLSIKRDKKLDSIFKEMSVTTPLTALSETPVKCKKAPLFSFHDKQDLTVNNISEMQLEPVLSPLPEPGDAKMTNSEAPPQTLPAVYMSSLSQDLEISDDSEMEMEEEEKQEVKEEQSKPEAPNTAAAAQEENHSSSDESSSSDSSSEGSDSDSSSSEPEDDEDGAKKEESADKKPDITPALDRGSSSQKDLNDPHIKDEEDSKSGRNKSWGLLNFMDKAAPAASSSSWAANNSSVGKEGTSSSQDVFQVKTSPRKMSEIGPCNTMPFITDEDAMARNCEKSSTSPDSLTPSSQTSSLDTTTGGQSKARRESGSDHTPSVKSGTVSKPLCERLKAAPSSSSSSLNSKVSENGGVGKPATSTVDAASKPSNQQPKPRRTNNAVKTPNRSSVSGSPSERDAPEGKAVSDRQQQGVSSSGQSSSTDSKKTLSSQNSGKGVSRSATRKNPKEDKWKKAANDSTAADIGSILKDVSVPPILSPTIPAFSDHALKDEAQATSLPIPTQTCGKPSIVVRLCPDLISRYPRPVTCFRSKAKKVALGKKDAGKLTEGFAASTPPQKGGDSHPSDSKQWNVKGAKGKTSGGGDVKKRDSASLELSVPPTKRKKADCEGSGGSKKQKAPASHIKRKLSPEINGVAHPEEVKKSGAKRPLERRNSVGSNSSRSSQKHGAKDSASSGKEPASKRPHKNESTLQPEDKVTNGSVGSDKAGSKEDLPFDSYKQPDVSPKPAVTGPPSLYQMLASDPILPYVLERTEHVDAYKTKAKEIKAMADKYMDRGGKVAPYLYSIFYFLMGVVAWERQHPNTDVACPRTITNNTFSLLLWVNRTHQDHNMSATPVSEKDKKLSILITRAISVVYFKMYTFGRNEVPRLKKIIDQEFRDKQRSSMGRPTAHAPSPHQNHWNKNSMGTPSPMSPTPSPACSIGSVESQREDTGDAGSTDTSGSRQTNGCLPNGGVTTPTSPATITVSQRVHSVTQKFVSYLSCLVRSDEFWEAANTEMQNFNLKEFFHSCDQQCGGALTINSSLVDLVVYGFTVLKETMKPPS